MTDRQKTLAAMAIIVGFIVLAVVVAGVWFAGRKIVSPIPEDNATIKIIFVSPTPSGSGIRGGASPSATIKITPTPTAE